LRLEFAITEKEANLDGFLDAVVDDEEHEDDLARQDEVIARGDVAQQLDGAQGPRRNNAASRRQLRHQPAPADH